jgi:hypothetical protein
LKVLEMIIGSLQPVGCLSCIIGFQIGLSWSGYMKHDRRLGHIIGDVTK